MSQAERFDIVWALGQCRDGYKIRRRHWNKGNHVIQRMHVGLDGKESPVFLFVTSGKSKSFFTCYSVDLNAQDWEVMP